MELPPLNRSASVVLGITSALFGLQQRGRTRVLFLAAGGGLLANAAARTLHPRADSPLSISRVITIGKSRDELYRMWCDPRILSRLFGDSLQVFSVGEGQIRSRITLIGGREITWTTKLVEQNPSSSLVWRTEPGAIAPHEMLLSFRDAQPASWGTEVTLGISLLPDNPVGRAIGRLTESIDEAILMKVLRRFKALVETGEMPTLDHNPSGRRHTITEH